MKVSVQCEDKWEADRAARALRGKLAYDDTTGKLRVDAEVDPKRTIKQVHVWRIQRRGLTGRGLPFGAGDGQVEAIADMLRYDVAFHDARWPDLVVTLTYKTKHGTHRGNVTVARWHSFSVGIEPVRRLETPDVPDAARSGLTLDGVLREPEQWITYVHATPSYRLERRTLSQWLAEVKLREALF